MKNEKNQNIVIKSNIVNQWDHIFLIETETQISTLWYEPGRMIVESNKTKLLQFKYIPMWVLLPLQHWIFTIYFVSPPSLEFLKFLNFTPGLFSSYHWMEIQFSPIQVNWLFSCDFHQKICQLLHCHKTIRFLHFNRNSQRIRLHLQVLFWFFRIRHPRGAFMWWLPNELVSFIFTFPLCRSTSLKDFVL